MIAALTNHLWQSTVFAAAAALLTMALRRNGAHVRHAIWVVASVKCVVPFALIVSAGSALHALMPVAAPAVVPRFVTSAAITVAVDRITQPFSDDTFAGATTAQSMDWMGIVLAGVWACGFVAVAIMRVRGWRRIRAALRRSAPLPLSSPVPVRSTTDLLEPGVIGIWRPVLLVPAGIEQHLTSRQMDAVIAHELCHVRRRDNLISAIHMAVEAIFWFYPVVWLVGAKLIEERERACDEHVLRVCGEPEAYAESIVNVCKRYVEMPLACVAGVGSSDLRQRIAAILVNRVGRQLSVARKLTLAMSALLTIALPLAAGSVLASARQSTPTFDVVSVKPCEKNAPGQVRGDSSTPITSPGRLHLQCYPLSTMITEAYLYFADGRAHGLSSTIDVGVEGGPDWMKSDRWEIDARTGQAAAAPALMRGPMLQKILEDRFKLKVRRVPRQMPIYELVPAKSGAKVAPYSGTDCVIKDEAAWPPVALPAGQRYCGDRSRVDGGRFIREGVMKLDELASLLGGGFDRPLVNRTGITAPVSYKFEYSVEGDAADRQAAVLAALKNELGLDVRSSKGPRDFLVIDHAERPSPNTPAADALVQAGAKGAGQ